MNKRGIQSDKHENNFYKEEKKRKVAFDENDRLTVAGDEKISEYDTLDWDWVEDMPNDTMSTILSITGKLKGSGCKNIPHIPVILQHNIYAVLENRTQVDQELAALRNPQQHPEKAISQPSGSKELSSQQQQQQGGGATIGKGCVRLVQLPTKNRDVGVVLASDYNDELSRRVRVAKGAGEVGVVDTFKAFKRLLSTHARLYILKGELAQVFEMVLRHMDTKVHERCIQNLKTKSQTRKVNAKTTRPLSKDAVEKYIQTQIRQRTTNAISYLVKAGFLRPRYDSKAEDAYWISVPEMGGFLRDLTKGRRAIINILNRTKYKEISVKELGKRNIQKFSSLPIWFHVQDLTGSGGVRVFKTASGVYLKIND